MIPTKLCITTKVLRSGKQIKEVLRRIKAQTPSRAEIMSHMCTTTTIWDTDSMDLKPRQLDPPQQATVSDQLDPGSYSRYSYRYN